MLGKPLVNNLTNYFDSISSLNINLYKFDRNQEKNLPCIVIGYDGEDMSFSGGYGHYTVGGFTNICFQGYDDPSNINADYYANIVIDALNNQTALFSAMNKPLSGTDTRPTSAFCLNGLFVRSVDRTIDGTSEEIEIKFDAFCAAKA